LTAAASAASIADDDDLAVPDDELTSTTTATTGVAFEDYAPSFFLDQDMTDDTSSSSTNTTIITLELPKHKPMGCTVEESLADGAILFVSSIVTGGNADTAGLRVGDVVTAITGLFGLIESTDGMDVAALYVWYLVPSSIYSLLFAAAAAAAGGMLICFLLCVVVAAHVF
jgi:C-terminal processing protease CtpA/Prc